MVIELLNPAELRPPTFQDDPATSIWHDERGRVLAYALKVEDWYWFRLERLATYRYPVAAVDGALRCVAMPDESADWDEVVDQYYRTLSVFALEAYGYASLHASAVQGPAGVVVLSALSRTGKTTLALELDRRGYTMVADDAVVIEARPRGVAAGPALRSLPFVPRVRPETASVYGVPVRERIKPPTGPVKLGRAQPLAAFVLIERLPSGAVDELQLERLAGREAFSGIMARAFFNNPKNLLKDPRAVADYLRISGRVPIYRLRYPSGFDVLGRVAAEVERLAVTPATAY